MSKSLDEDLTEKQIQAFSRWLAHHGAVLSPPQADTELIRFSCEHGTGILIQGRYHQTASDRFVMEAVQAYRTGGRWNGTTPLRKGSLSPSQKRRARRQIMNRDGLTCFYCGLLFGEQDLVLEHLLDRQHEGPSKPVNMVLACVPCSREVQAKSLSLPEKIQFRDLKRREILAERGRPLLTRSGPLYPEQE